MKNIRIVPSKNDGLGTTRVHFHGPTMDMTLCGFTLDGDEYCIESQEETDAAANCEQCWAIVAHCRTIKQRTIGRATAE